MYVNILSISRNKPSSFIRNLMVGTKYLEHSGKMTIENVTNNARCVLDFKQNGYWGPSNLVSGTVYSSSGEAVSQLEGKWDDQIAQTLDDSHFRILWRVTPFPKNAHEYYGFTSFGITLNEITPDLVGRLPPTDSRNRPDVRALEEGDLERAEEKKTLVEGTSPVSLIIFSQFFQPFSKYRLAKREEAAKRRQTTKMVQRSWGRVDLYRRLLGSKGSRLERYPH